MLTTKYYRALRIAMRYHVTRAEVDMLGCGYFNSISVTFNNTIHTHDMWHFPHIFCDIQGSCGHGKLGKVMEFEKVFPGLEKLWKTRNMPKVMEKSWKMKMVCQII